jgi:hypothetical protein
MYVLYSVHSYRRGDLLLSGCLYMHPDAFGLSGRFQVQQSGFTAWATLCLSCSSNRAAGSYRV